VVDEKDILNPMPYREMVGCRNTSSSCPTDDHLCSITLTRLGHVFVFLRDKVYKINLVKSNRIENTVASMNNPSLPPFTKGRESRSW